MRLRDLAEKLGGRTIGDDSVDILSAAPVDEAGPGQITFIANPKYLPRLAHTRASAVIVSPGVQEAGQPLLVVPNPYLAFARVLTLLCPPGKRRPGVSRDARVEPGARLGKDVIVHPFVFIGEGAGIGDRVELQPGVTVGEGCIIGEDTVIHANVSVYPRCLIGKRVVIHSSAVIGSDGFGFARDGTRYEKIPQVGIVEIGDDVEIGANTTIDRATMGKTVVGRGTKIDNLVQIAHNVIIGEDCIIVSQTGISGSTRIGNNVTLAGQVGVVGHLAIGDNVLVGAQSGVGHDVAAGTAVSGSPAFPHKEWLKAVTAFRSLPDMRKRLRDLEKKLEETKEEKK